MRSRLQAAELCNCTIEIRFVEGFPDPEPTDLELDYLYRFLTSNASTSLRFGLAAEDFESIADLTQQLDIFEGPQ